MSMAMCPYCSTKLQIPGNITAGMAMLCGNCNNQFLPPQVSSRRDDEEDYTPRKKKKKKGRKKMAANTVATLVILGCIVLLLSGLGIFYLMQPSHAKFNEGIVAQYNRMDAVLNSLQIRPGTNNISGFLKQFQPLSAQLEPILKEVRELRVPDDSIGVQQSFTSTLESLIRFCSDEAPNLADKLRKKPNDEKALSAFAMSWYSIAQHHQALVQGQNTIAKKYGLLQIQPRGNQGLFSISDRER